MTTEDMFAAAIVGVLVVYWLWRHPAAAEVIGLVFLVGLICVGTAAHAQLHGRRHHRRRYQHGHPGRHYRRQHYGRRWRG
jgi:hypothetical protein